MGAQTSVPVGAGGYDTEGDFAVPAGKPWITDDFAQPVVSATWWATLISGRYSEALFAHPGSCKATTKGLEMGYPGATASPDGIDFSSPHAAGLTVGVEAIAAEAARVAAYSDWSVTARWTDGPRLLEATVGHGLPFVYFRVSGGRALITTGGTVWYDKDGTLGITAGGRAYGVFAPTGSAWTAVAGGYASPLGGKEYLSVAVLPDGSPETMAFFRKYAFAFVQRTRVDWSYGEADARLVSTFTVETEAKEGTERGTVFALFRHQWLSTADPLTGYVYSSARGEMKVVAGPSFTTKMQFNGILPAMPLAGTDATALKALADGFTGDAEGGDTYAAGKALGRLAAMAPIADLAGAASKRDEIVKKIEAGLEDWLSPGGAKRFFYNKTWSSLVGYPAAYGADTRLSDHHFHYGYFILAAAAVARFDPPWAARDRWGGMVDLLIREVSAPDGTDSRFGRFRYFDPYEGHGWADGQGFARGNNQESSSESMNCAAGIIQWGIETGDKAIRDLGIFMYAHEARAIEQYWLDVDGAVFPAGFRHSAAGMVWSDGGAYATWFSAEPGHIHGINIFPIAAGSLYLGRRPDHILKNFGEGDQGIWRDLFLEYLAFADGERASALYGAGVEPEGGDSRAHAAYHIRSLQSIGRLDTAIGASVPSFAVFDRAAGVGNAGIRTYTAYNPGAAPVTVAFTDGFRLDVPAHAQATKAGPAVPLALAPGPRPAGASGRAGQRLWNFLANPPRPSRAGTDLYDLKGRRLGSLMLVPHSIP